MPSIFSTQNLQTFLRRKNLRPPSRGPPGPPPGRGPRGPPRSGRSPPLRSGRLSPWLDPDDAVGAFVSSAIVLLLSINSILLRTGLQEPALVKPRGVVRRTKNGGLSPLGSGASHARLLQ